MVPLQTSLISRYFYVKMLLKMIGFLAIIFLMSECTTSRPTVTSEPSSEFMEDTLFQSLALRRKDYGKLLDSCMIWSDYLNIKVVPARRKIVYRPVSKNALGSGIPNGHDSLVVNVCFNREGLAIQSIVVHSNLSKKQDKEWLLNAMNYRAEPAKNSLDECPQCGHLTFRFK